MSELQSLLTEFAAGRVALVERHEASARAVSHYDFNNTYQYVINREETHLSWLQNALAEYKAVLPPAGPSALPAPQPPKVGKNVEASAFRGILEDEARYLGAFVEKWRPRVDHLTHARHRNMLNVILGESMEHRRFFEQAAGGFEDLLGRRTPNAERVGGVLPTRWLEQGALRIAIALGSNLGDREAQLRGAVAALSPVLAHLRVSSFHETEPVGMPMPQPMFLNAAAVGESTLSAPAILDVLLAVEQGFGRERPYELAPRTIDLDLILYGNAVINSPGLTVPHPRFRERRFVLEPLAEIAPDWVDPVTGKTVEELFAVLRHSS